MLTLELDEHHQARFDAERAALFPAGRTQVAAHVTLFHALPAELETRVLADLDQLADRPRFAVGISELMPLGRGVAYRLRSGELDRLHAELRRRWSGELTRQDQQGFRAHITVQNKVEPELARRTLAELAAGFVPFEVEATGLRTWRYRGGPWQPYRRFPFAGKDDLAGRGNDADTGNRETGTGGER